MDFLYTSVNLRYLLVNCLMKMHCLNNMILTLVVYLSRNIHNIPCMKVAIQFNFNNSEAVLCDKIFFNQKFKLMDIKISFNGIPYIIKMQ